jgi:hypothetical protein
MAALTHISQIQQEHLNHLETYNFSQNQKILNALRYNPAILATATHQVVLQLSATIQQTQNNRLSTDFLRGETVNIMFYFGQASGIAKGLEPLMNNLFDLYQIEVS